MKKFINIFLILLFIVIIYFCMYYQGYRQTFEQNYEQNNKGIYTAIIVEPRQHNAMEFVLTNFTNFLDERWNFIIFHGTQNQEFVENIIDNKLQKDKDRIKLINLNVDNLTIHDYNTLFFDKSFYDNIPTETFLVFQTDSMICEKHKDIIYEFINYDYVGAPWSFNKQVGNGGLSLRKKSKMLELLEKCSHANQNEDMIFANLSDCIHMNKPSFEDAKTFSIETVDSDKSFEIHKPWAYLQINDKINDFCPGFNELKNLQ